MLFKTSGRSSKMVISFKGCRTTAPLTSSYIQGRSCRGQGRSCRGQGRSCRGQVRSCRQYWYAYLHTSYLRHALCMYRSLEAPSKTSDTIFWVAVMLWSAAFIFRELKKVDFSSMRLSGAWLCGLEPWLRALLVSR